MILQRSTISSRPGSPSHRHDNEHLILKTSRGKSMLRWLILLLSCTTTFGSYFCFDNPQALQTYMESRLRITASQFNSLYSVYSFPNILLPFFAGIIIDYFDARTVLVCLAFVITIGQAITTLGTFYSNFTMMIIGRIIFGLGGESLNIARSTILAQWFLNKELGFALGMAISVGFLGNSINSLISPHIYQLTHQLYYPFFIGFIFCAVSCITGFLLYYIDGNYGGKRHVDYSKKKDLKNFGLQEFRSFKLQYIFLLLASFFLYGALYGLRDNLNDLLVERFQFTPEKAGYLILHVYLFPTVLTPFIGMFIDRFGYRVLLVIFFTLLFEIELLYLTFIKDNDQTTLTMLPGLIIIGLFHATFSVIFWSSIPKVLGTKDTGFAYGFATSAQNLIQAVVPILIGHIHDKTLDISMGYFWSLIPLIVLGFLGIIMVAVLSIDDWRQGSRLNRSKSEIHESELVSA